MEVGQKVILKGDHPWKGEVGTIVRFEKMKALNKVRPVVHLENVDNVDNLECFVTRDDQMDLLP